MQFSKKGVPAPLRLLLGRMQRLFVHAAWAVRSMVARGSVLGDADVVVSMTTHGSRTRRVHHAFESIARGEVRPVRMILWIDEQLEGHRLPRGVRRLQRRGLEIGYHKDDMGPHMKYFPYVMSQVTHTRPLVTADDDKRYTKDWLKGLVEAHETNKSLICSYISRRIAFDGDELATYGSWQFVYTDTPHRKNSVLGFCGVLHPPEFLDVVRARGEQFRSCTPMNDDIWLTYVAVTSGFIVWQIRARPLVPATVLGAETLALRRTNLFGGNDEQAAKTFGSKPRHLFESTEEKQPQS